MDGKLTCCLIDIKEKAKATEDEKSSLITVNKLFNKKCAVNSEHLNLSQTEQINSEDPKENAIMQIWLINKQFQQY